MVAVNHIIRALQGLAAPACLCALLLFGGVATAQERLVIGIGAPLSGQFELFGQSILDGASAAIASVNDAGGAGGLMLDLATADDVCNPNKAEAAANQLIGAGADAIIGHVCYSATRQAAAIYAEAGLAQITPASEAEGLTARRPAPGLFRLAPRTRQQGTLLGQHMADRFANIQIAILHDGTAYGKDLADTVKAALNQADVQEAWFSDYESGADSYRRLATRIGDNRIGALFLGGYHEDIARIVLAVREAGLETRIIGPDTLADAEFQAIAGAATEGVLFALPAPLDTSNAAKGLLKALDVTPSVASDYLLRSHAAIEVFAQAMAKAGTEDLSALTKTLQSTTFDTIIGPVAFDEAGNWTRSAFSLFEWGPDGYHMVK